MQRISLTALVFLGLAGAARADKDARAQSVFDSKCAACHTLGHAIPDQRMSQKKVDLTSAATRKKAAELKAWLAEPRPGKDGEVVCQTRTLDAVERDLLFGLLSARSHPDTARPQVAPARWKPPKSRESVPRPAGLGDRR
jgi:hypothetical protein